MTTLKPSPDPGGTKQRVTRVGLDVDLRNRGRLLAPGFGDRLGLRGVDDLVRAAVGLLDDLVRLRSDLLGEVRIGRRVRRPTS